MPVDRATSPTIKRRRRGLRASLAGSELTVSSHVRRHELAGDGPRTSTARPSRAARPGRIHARTWPETASGRIEENPHADRRPSSKPCGDGGCNYLQIHDRGQPAGRAAGAGCCPGVRNHQAPNDEPQSTAWPAPGTRSPAGGRRSARRGRGQRAGRRDCRSTRPSRPRRGRAAEYASACASCHLSTLQGSFEAPELAGPNFVNRWGRGVRCASSSTTCAPRCRRPASGSARPATSTSSPTSCSATAWPRAPLRSLPTRRAAIGGGDAPVAARTRRRRAPRPVARLAPRARLAGRGSRLPSGHRRHAPRAAAGRLAELPPHV